jgi:hypothetical protein
MRIQLAVLRDLDGVTVLTVRHPPAVGQPLAVEDERSGYPTPTGGNDAIAASNAVASSSWSTIRPDR